MDLDEDAIVVTWYIEYCYAIWDMMFVLLCDYIYYLLYICGLVNSWIMHKRGDMLLIYF
jgi:hypothetical protein